MYDIIISNIDQSQYKTAALIMKKAGPVHTGSRPFFVENRFIARFLPGSAVVCGA
jgi:hypothetical protein